VRADLIKRIQDFEDELAAYSLSTQPAELRAQWRNARRKLILFQDSKAILELPFFNTLNIQDIYDTLNQRLSDKTIFMFLVILDSVSELKNIQRRVKFIEPAALPQFLDNRVQRFILPSVLQQFARQHPWDSFDILLLPICWNDLDHWVLGILDKKQKTWTIRNSFPNITKKAEDLTYVSYSLTGNLVQLD
jgi:hypothetical protein